MRSDVIRNFPRAVLSTIFCLAPVLAVCMSAGHSIAQERPTGKKQDLIVAAHYAPWYAGEQIGWTGNKGGRLFRTAYTPLLGYYNNSDPNVVSQQIEWARRYGLNTFMIEWSGVADTTYPRTLDPVVQEITQMGCFKSINFYFVYSIISALRKHGDGIFDPVDFDDKGNVRKFVSDMKYAARNYFELPNHLKFKGRPVIYIWAVGLSQGNFAGAVKSARKAVKKQCGKDPYLIADEVWWSSAPDLDRTTLFDAVMPYAMINSVGQPPADYALKDSIDEIISQYQFWHYVCDDLGIDFIPGVIPGFNPAGAHWCFDDDLVPITPTVTRSKKSFQELVSRARPFVDADINMFYITSWSEWNEGTNIEPSKEFKFAYLKALKKGLAKPSKFEPAKGVIEFRFKRVFDPEGPDDRLLAVAFDWIEFLDASQNVLLKIDMGAVEARSYMGIGWSSNEQQWGEDVENFVWAGTKLKTAYLHIDPPAGTSRLRIRMLQIDSQVTKVNWNSTLLAELPAAPPWGWATYVVDF
jgi:hypothetical protein